MKKKLIYIGIFGFFAQFLALKVWKIRRLERLRNIRRKYCPTPYVNDSSTDSATFDKTTQGLHLLCHSCETRQTTRRRLMPTGISCHKLAEGGPGQQPWPEEIQGGPFHLPLHLSFGKESEGGFAG